MLANELAAKYPFLNEYTSPVKKAEREIVGREKEMRQVLASLMRPELCNVMLLAEAGSGKAFEDSTLIPVDDERGYVPIAELKVGDSVFDENGNPVKVLGVYPQGLKRAYRMIFGDGSQLVCNDEHLWNVRTRWQHLNDKGYTTMTLRQMMEYGIVRSLSSGNMKSFYIPKNGGLHRKSVDLPIHPYAMGALIGDGCLSGERALAISSPNEGVPEKIAKLIGAKGVERNPNNYSWYFLSNGDKKFVTQAEMADRCGVDDVFFTKSIHRRIPKEYMIADKEQRMCLLQGLMDTDGSLGNSDRHHCLFSTNSEGLAEDVLELVRSLGIRASLIITDRDDKDNPEYSVHMKLPDSEKRKLFTDASGKGQILMEDNRRYHRIYDDMSVADVTDLGYDVSMTCIYVDSESHLFQAGKEHIVTHNTALVQGTMLKDTDRVYLEVDLSRMIANLNDVNEMATKLKTLFDEAAAYSKDESQQLVLFIDEFHQIVQLSPAAVEALKPLLADSGTRGVRVIAATTYEEFRKYISPNQPLVERLQRINLKQPNKEMTVAILKGMAKRYGVETQFYNDNVYNLIYEYTNRYIPASSQPRKSLLVLDSMIGWHRAENRKMDMSLLADVIYESAGVNVSFRVDAKTIKQELDAHVFAQSLATSVIEQRLQIAVADLNDSSKPMSTFLFCGSTGVGKTEVTKQLARILFEDSRNLIRMDMTEFANSDSLERFRNELTARVWERPYSIVLLDEIEKACSEVTRILLQVLDDGRLNDENNREVSFQNCYIILTTNAGSEIFDNISQYAVDDTGSGKQMKRYNKLIRSSISRTTGDNRFPPELLGRIDTIVPFQPLSEDTMKRIVRTKLQKLKDEVRQKHNVDLKIHKDVIKYLVEDNMDTNASSGGARIVMSKLEEEVTTAVARFINLNPDVSRVGVKVEGTMASDDKTQLISEAYITVGTI